MTDLTTTLELPRFYPITDDQPAQAVLLPSRLDAIVQRNALGRVNDAIFALGLFAFAVVSAIGIAGS